MIEIKFGFLCVSTGELPKHDCSLIIIIIIIIIIIFSSKHDNWKNFKRGKRKISYVLQNNVNFNIFKKRISEISLKYSAKSWKDFCVLKVLYQCLMMI